MSSIKIDRLAAVITKELQEYQQEVTDGIKEAVQDAAKQCVKDIRKNAPVLTGSYKKGWRARKEYESLTDIRYTVYNKTDYQLTHLLENGHAKRNGGRVEGHPHIAPAERTAAETLKRKAKVIIKA